MSRNLEEKMISMIRALDSMPYDIVTNRELDKFYYMQKLAELKMLDDKLYEVLERVRVMMAARYDTRREVMARWKRDVRWLASHKKEAGAIENKFL